jgi:serine/threonine protein phosphatase 1
MKRFVISDIHGYYSALMQCFERSGFDNQSDLLICLGDTCDRGPDTFRCFDELLKVKHLIYILGNHDQWFRSCLNSDKLNLNPIWLNQGGRSTLKSYQTNPVPPSHLKLLNEALLYKEMDNMLFVHAGFLPDIPIELNETVVLLWDRTLIQTAFNKKDSPGRLTHYDKVFVGHTPTVAIEFKSKKPLMFNEFRMTDTGVITGNHLSILNIDTDDIFQSDRVCDLYPDRSFCSI